jgi:hypothetical protein
VISLDDRKDLSAAWDLLRRAEASASCAVELLKMVERSCSLRGVTIARQEAASACQAARCALAVVVGVMP